jgi:hypothetical protein
VSSLSSVELLSILLHGLVRHSGVAVSWWVVEALRKPTPGPMFVWVKWLSWVELGIFSLLIVFWLVPGFETETMLFGWAHGLGFVVLCIVIWIACGRRETPYTLLAATLTPVGPVGSVIGIELIERRGWGVADSPQRVAESPQTR